MEFKEILDYIFAPIIGYNIWLHNQIYKNKDDIRDNKEEINANSINDKFRAKQLESIDTKFEQISKQLKEMNDSLIQLNSSVVHLENNK